MKNQTKASSTLWHLAAAVAICMADVGMAQAQPSAVGTVTPPVRADMALSGSVLTSRNAANHLACQTACKSTSSCTGFSFNRNAKANCSLLAGTLTDVPVVGAVSCRMPCVPSPRATLSPRPLTTETLREPGIAKPSATGRP